jgi:hypothetical protein
MDDLSKAEQVRLLGEAVKALQDISRKLDIVVMGIQAQNPQVFPNADVNFDRKKE